VAWEELLPDKVISEPAIGRADARGRVVAGPDVQDTVEALYERHGARVLTYCRRRLRSADEAEDALQTTFLYACRGLRRGVVPESEIAWLLKIAHNVCLSTWDSNRRRRRLEVVRDPEQLERATEAAHSGRENVIALETALGDLTDLQRQAIILREWRGLSYQEIAEQLALSRSAVETLIFRGRRAVARSLDRQEVERPRTLARCLDLGGLLSALKSALGLGGNAKLAVGLVGAAVLAGSIPDAPKRPASERPPTATALSIPAVDPAPTSAHRRIRAAADEPILDERRPARKERSERPQRRDKSEEAAEASGGLPAVGRNAAEASGGLPAVGRPVGQTVEGATDVVNETVRRVKQTVDETLPDALPPVHDVVDGVVGDGSGAGLLP
jgi:RNA polymerase sigma-70 factor, ECF subfamily